MVLCGCSLNWAPCYLCYNQERIVYQIQEGHCLLPLSTAIIATKPARLLRPARPVELISNCSTSHQCDGLNRETQTIFLYVTKCYVGRKYLVRTKFEGKLFSWIQLTHENVTQQVKFYNYVATLSQTNISQTVVCLL